MTGVLARFAAVLIATAAVPTAADAAGCRALCHDEIASCAEAAERALLQDGASVRRVRRQRPRLRRRCARQVLSRCALSPRHGDRCPVPVGGTTTSTTASSTSSSSTTSSTSTSTTSSSTTSTTFENTLDLGGAWQLVGAVTDRDCEDGVPVPDPPYWTGIYIIQNGASMRGAGSLGQGVSGSASATGFRLDGYLYGAVGCPAGGADVGLSLTGSLSPTGELSVTQVLAFAPVIGHCRCSVTWKGVMIRYPPGRAS